MTKQRFIIKLLWLISKITIPLLIWSYFLIAKPKIFTDTDSVLAVKQFLLTTPWLYIIFVMMLYGDIKSMIWRKSTAKKEKKTFIENQPEQVQNIIDALEERIEILESENDEYKTTNKNLKKENHEKTIFIKQTEETINAFKTNNRNYDKSLKQ